MKNKTNYQYLWLGLAAMALFFTGGKYNVFPAAWVGSIFFIRFCRGRKAVSGYFMAVAVAWVVSVVSWRGIQPMTGVAYFVSMLVAALISTLPLLADRLLYRRLPGWLSTLVFPAVSTAIEYLFVSTNPMGSFGAIAYSQFGFSPLLQFASIGGLTGIAFLINWFPALVNHLWERSWKSSRVLMISAGSLYVAVLLFGAARIILAEKDPSTVEVSMIIRGTGNENLRSILGKEAARSAEAERFLQDLVDQTVAEAAAGAKIVAWPEGSIVIGKNEMPGVREQLSALSEELGIYLVAPYFVFNGEVVENGLDIYSPAGDIRLNHIKYGGNVFEGSVPGDGILRYIDTEYGRIAAAVCWDMDFPDAIQQAGRDSVDILISPSCEWREIVPTHARMAIFRGVENGLNTVHPASLGLSVAADPYGKIAGELNWFESDDSVLRVSVPIKGTATPYARFGELFGPLSIALSILLIVFGSLAAIISARRGRKNTNQT